MSQQTKPSARCFDRLASHLTVLADHARTEDRHEIGPAQIESGGVLVNVDEQKRCCGLSPIMCEKCRELDQKIARYRQIAERVLDAQLTDGLAKLIEEAEAEKVALHAEGRK
jgi:hypothetical protein